ncbi:FkbM family methyltransferase [Clostridium botulinum]|nr:FkbM family methyltransferase [Clostridium botulinum]NFS95788.1 FkbM family methyltransferase [Clostridium botulinum]
MDMYLKNIRTIKDIKKYEKIVLFGAGQTSKGTIRLLKDNNLICLFDSDSSKWGNKIDGYYVHSPSDISNIVDDNTAIVISCISNQYEISIELINKYNIKKDHIFSYTNKYYEDFVYDTKKIINNFNRIKKVIDLLEDNESKEYLKNSIICRLTRDPLYIKQNSNIKVPYEYSNIVLPKKGDVIIDCGAYIGDTAELFLKKLNEECKIYCIEPFEDSYDQLCSNVRLNNISNKVECLYNAVSNEKRTDYIRCNEDAAYVCANLKDNQGKLGNKINVDKIDNLFKDINQIDFIKMDIEGEEVNALNGASNVIRNMKPNMMISAYHLVEHIWKIPETIKNIDSSYKIYAGHQPMAPFEIEFYLKSNQK